MRRVVNRTFDDGIDIAFKRGLLIVARPATGWHWIGFRARVQRIGKARQVQLWLGFIWVEWSNWVFWGCE